MPRTIVHRITVPVLVLSHNINDITTHMQRGEILFLQRALGPRCAAVPRLAAHRPPIRRGCVAACDPSIISPSGLRFPRSTDGEVGAQQNLALSAGDCIIRRGNKYRYREGMNGPSGVDRADDRHRRPVPPLTNDDIPLPVQTACQGIQITSGWTLCFGDRVRVASTGSIVDPLECISWPTLHIGDVVLIVPQPGAMVLVNRQPTLVRTGDPRTEGDRRTAGIDAVVDGAGGLRRCPSPASAANVRVCASSSAPICRFPRAARRWRPSEEISDRRSPSMRTPGRDGDEINLHFPQSSSVTAELQELMSVPHQIVTGQSSGRVSARCSAGIRCQPRHTSHPTPGRFVSNKGARS